MFELNRKKGTATKLRARFPKVHPKAELDITFQRTLRIPDDGKDYPLPAGLGHLPLRYIEDCEGELSEHALNRGSSGLSAAHHQPHGSGGHALG